MFDCTGLARFIWNYMWTLNQNEFDTPGLSVVNFTCVRTRVEVTGAVFDAEPVAVFPSVLGDGVVTLSFGRLNSTATSPRAVPKTPPLPPATIHLQRHPGVSRAHSLHKEAPF